jgi:hypothetical protein
LQSFGHPLTALPPRQQKPPLAAETGKMVGFTEIAAYDLASLRSIA